LAELAAKRAYGAEAAALDMKSATGQAAYNQSQLDRTLEGVGLDAADFRVGESITAEPYRALEADQAGVASGQRRYAQDVRAAAVASEEKKIALAQQKVADAKAESDRALGVMLQGIQSSQRNSDRSYGAQIDAQRLQSEFNADMLELTAEGQATTAEWQEDTLVLQTAANASADTANGLNAEDLAAWWASMGGGGGGGGGGAGAPVGTTSTLTAAQQWEINNPGMVRRIGGETPTPPTPPTAEEVATANNQFMWG